MDITEEKKKQIAEEFLNIMGIVSEGLGSQYGVFIKSNTTINIEKQRGDTK